MATEQIILEGIDKTQKAFSSVQKSLNRVEGNTHKAGRAFDRLRNIVIGAAAAIGAIKLSKGFLNTAVEVENLGIQLKFLTGSADEGAKAMDTLTKFAAGVPFELQQIANAAPNLLTVASGTEELNELLAVTGDIAAATGLDFKTTAEQLQRAFSGGIAAADIFREKGVKSLLGFEEGVRYNAEQTKELILSSFRDGTTTMKGASAEMANTFTGTMSMLSDKLFQFQKHLMDSGPFHFIKALLKDLNSFIDSRFGSIENAAEVMGQKIVQAFQAAMLGLARFADMITPVVKFAGNAIKGLVDMVNGLPGTIKAVGLIGFLMLGIKGKLVVLAIGAVFNKVKLMFAEVMDFMASGKDKLAGLMEALGFDEYAKALRTNAAEIRDSNNKLRTDIEKTKDSILENNEDIVISMGKFGEITQEELEKAGPLTQALAKYFAELNVEMAKSAEISKLLDYEDPIIKMAEANKKQLEEQKRQQEEALALQDKENALMLLKKKTFNKLVTDAEAKEARKRLFIEVELNKKKLAFQQTVAEAEKAFNENRTTALKSYTDGFMGEMQKQMNVFEQLGQAGANAFNGMADVLTQFVMTGKFNFKQFANSVIADLVRIAAKQAIVFALKKAIGFFGFGIPFLADGGPVKKNKPYVVGEEGPELFVPNSSGSVISNQDLQKTSGSRVGGKEVTVNFNVTAMDAESFQGKLAEQRDTIVSIINEAVTDTGRSPITA